jgi:RNA polymerase sigma-70 factor (ECF subfamily)
MGLDFLDAYGEHVSAVYGYLGYRVATRADAEDLTQVTFERAFKAWDRYDPGRASVRTWLLAIARNALVDKNRRDRSTPHESLGERSDREAQLPHTPGPEASVGLSPDLAAALATLGRRERAVIALRFGADLRGPEIAEMLELSLANVQQITSRALRRLRTELETGEEARDVRSGRERADTGKPDRRERQERQPSSEVRRHLKP